MTNRTLWEYSRVQVLMTKKGPLISVNGTQVSKANLTDLLNEAGRDGWEMVGMTAMVAGEEVHQLFLLKRPL